LHGLSRTGGKLFPRSITFKTIVAIKNYETDGAETEAPFLKLARVRFDFSTYQAT
jgi:hypothetical protein